jgi:MFS family permease
MLFLPVWVIFLQQERGLTLTQVTFVDVAFWLTTAAAELPTGMVADTFGRKASVTISVLMTTGAVLLFGLTQNFFLLMVANSLWAIAITFESGAGLALLYDSLKEVGREEDYSTVRARLSIVALVSTAVSTILGGMVGNWNMEATFVITAILMVVSLLFVLTLKEPPYDPDPDTGERIKYARSVGMTFEALKQSPNLRMVMLYRNLLPVGGALVAITFFQPHAVNIGISIKWIGIYLFSFRMFRLAGAAAVSSVQQKMGVWRWLWLAPAIVLIGFVALGLLETWVGLLVFGLVGFSSAVTGPITEAIVMKATPGAVRATVLSVDMLIFYLLQSGIELGMGVMGQRYGLPEMFLAIGVGTWLVLTVVLARWRKVWQDMQLAPKVKTA